MLGKLGMLGWALLGLLGCSTNSGGNGMTTDTPSMMDPMDECNPPGGFCEHASPACNTATAECIEGTPRTLGPCICRSPALQKIGPTRSYASVPNIAFATDSAYWLEYVFTTPPVTSIVKGPIAQPGQVLVEVVAGGANQLRVTEDTIYARDGDDPPLAYSLTGELLPAPDPEVAFPPVVHRVNGSEVGLYLDGMKVGAGVLHAHEVKDGAYYIPLESMRTIKFLSFANPLAPANVLEMPTRTDAAQFSGVWATSDDLYVETWLPDSDTYELSYVDFSIVGGE
jgi:hypothetical protein